ncbi:MAG TPA: carboxylating nicotinate-nucleotide diphosphorylase [Thermoanaerobaculia bacterium]|nr:carboxylating nicotinate-nucleotide diphosphorylase [Thermoanaerobaculia bacterium]
MTHSTILPDVSSLLRESLARFLAEDLGRGDVTTEAIVPEGATGRAAVFSRASAVVCGLDVAGEVFRFLDPAVAWNASAPDGTRISPGERIASASGDARALLSGERVALNLLQRMSGIATATRRYVDAVEGTGCRVLDTRKTAPGLRALDKRAVAAGGGANHRFGLDDGVLIKDNHLAIAGSVAEAVARVRRRAPHLARIEVEVEDESALREALAAGADAILIDNRPPRELAGLVAVARRIRPDVRLEASGGVTLENVRAYAETGVDFVSIGALTHSVAAVDLAMEISVA